MGGVPRWLAGARRRPVNLPARPPPYIADMPRPAAGSQLPAPFNGDLDVAGTDLDATVLHGRPEIDLDGEEIPDSACRKVRREIHASTTPQNAT